MIQVLSISVGYGHRQEALSARTLRPPGLRFTRGTLNGRGDIQPTRYDLTKVEAIRSRSTISGNR